LKHLAHAWNTLVSEDPEHLDENAFGAWAKENVRVSAYQLETTNVTLGEGNRSNTGFTGWATFSVKPENQAGNFLSLVDRLLLFAEHCNVGGGRNTGLGMVKYLPRVSRGVAQPRVDATTIP
jgi:CRISPR/Cas system endoribonuclease Cas6 (RAMP superfamily)